MSNVRMTRRAFLKLGLGAGALVSGGLGGYAALLEPRALSVERITLRLPRLPHALDGLTLVQLSDFHHGTGIGDDEVRAAVEASNALAPDLVVLTGDYVTAFNAGDHVWPCVRQLSQLRTRLGMYAIMGNHDYWADGALVRDAMRAHDIPLLLNTATAIEHNGARLWLIGVEDVALRYAYLERALRGAPNDDAKILLAHEPDFADFAARFPIDLQLSGHAHGGQVRLPGVGPLFLPSFGQKYVMGLYRVGALLVYTTRGIGMIPPTVRFNCPPEVTHVTLRTA